MARIHELLNQLRPTSASLADDIKREYDVVADRRAFGLNFERHTPEEVELPGRKVRVGDKVHILPPRGESLKAEAMRLWRVVSIATDDREKVATIEQHPAVESADSITKLISELVVVAEFRDPIYPGLVSTGRVERGGDKPFHTVINGENYHALQTLMFTHRGQVDAIYIDPPYNSGARDWKYNNDYIESEDLYRHSKWLAWMERRLLLAKELLNAEDSVLIVSIDEKEYLRLGLLLEQSFPEADIQMISSLINPAVVARAGQFGRSDEYIYFVTIGAASPQRVRLQREWVSARGRTHTGSVRWDLLRRSGEGARREDSPGCFYPIYVDPSGPCVHSVGETLPSGVSSPEPIVGITAVLPIRKDGSEGRWQWTPATFRSRLALGRVKIGGSERKGFSVSILKDGEYAKIVDGEFHVTGHGVDGSIEVESQDTDYILAIPGTQWRISSHDATQYGTRLLATIIPERRFPFPKSLYAVEDTLRFFVAGKRDATIVDFFSGSGTTAHAVMRLNKQDGGQRISISVTNNEVSADEQANLRRQGLRPGDPDWEQWGICEYITKPRIASAITGMTPAGEPIHGDYKFTDVFPMADGFAENVEFLTLTYEAPLRVQANREFGRVAPFLWLRAGSCGRRLDVLPDGWGVADTYGVLADLDRTDEFIVAMATNPEAKLAFIVTDEDRLFEAVVRDLPARVEPVRMYESYLRNFEIDAMRSVR
jgi:adenine-specific DNA-methyltransferase